MSETTKFIIETACAYEALEGGNDFEAALLVKRVRYGQHYVVKMVKDYEPYLNKTMTDLLDAVKYWEQIIRGYGLMRT